MRELYLLAVGVMAGVVLVDFMERMERRVAYRAADIAADFNRFRSVRAAAQEPDQEAPAPAPAAA